MFKEMRTINDKIYKVYYNAGYELEICVIIDQSELPLFLYKGKTLKPFYKKSNTKWSYPMVNIDGKINYCHRIVAYSCLNDREYAMMHIKNKDAEIVVDHINGNIEDYRPMNLQYLYNSDNTKKDNNKCEKI